MLMDLIQIGEGMSTDLCPLISLLMKNKTLTLYIFHTLATAIIECVFSKHVALLWLKGSLSKRVPWETIGHDSCFHPLTVCLSGAQDLHYLC